MFYQETISSLSKDIEFNEKLAVRLERELNTLPEGSLRRKVSGGTIRYFQRIRSGAGNQSVIDRYISTKDEYLKQALKRKQITKKYLQRVYVKIKLGKKFINMYPNSNLEEFEASLTASYAGIPCDYLFEATGKLNSYSDWEQEPYIKFNGFPEGLKCVTMKGLKVRSKSEMIIADMLDAENIPYRYEAELVLGNQSIYPDFTICRPEDGKIIYWEHFGMADDRQYSMAMHQKMDLYISHGILPGNGLIISCETRELTIGTRIIHNIIKAYL